ncbi:speckle targeted PIP5K1A-regulated poly(A) polymerase-like [Cydia fagiglandana]|uniref:speckle targeted PIP5K1A-regulated poly(A) polymerase-like n=1 Tax=Cydia fagiglandana TaxID=1458189 RepID=UPI002FEE579E
MEGTVTRVPSRPTFSRPPFAAPHSPSHSRPWPPAAAVPLAPGRLQLSAPAGRGAGRGAGREVRSAEARRRRGEADELLPNAVLVTGYPPYTKPQDLAHAFCKFGSVRLNQDWITDTAACLEFTEPEHAQAAIRASRAVNVYGAFLTVTACTVNTRPQRQPRKREPRVGKGQNFKGAIVEPTKIPLQGGFHQQLEALLRAVRLTQPEIERLGQLYRDLECVLGELWPGCRAIPFGSVTTGLGVKSSDADCFVSLPRAAAGGAVGRAKRALAAHPRVFDELLAIPRANTPIVKFLHIPTGVYCDLSFKTPLGSQNSKLISFLLFCDPRLVPVAVAVKYWARVHELTGTGKLTNYALTMMIIFYFQQPPISILPSVEWLQRDRSYDYFVDYWNTGFMSDMRFVPKSANTSSIAALLGGFFEYYAKFDFENLVVCPFLGQTVKKDDFRDLSLLPEVFSRYKKNVSSGVSLPIRFMTSMCVQDPFEQCHNVASSVSSRLAADICAYFKFAAAAYEKEKMKDFSGLLPTILLEKPELPRSKKGGSEFRARLPPGLVANIAAPDWKAAVRDVAFQVFQTILRVQLDKLEDKEETVKPSQQAKPGQTSKGGNISKPEERPGSSKSGETTKLEETTKLGKKSEDVSKLGLETCKPEVVTKQRKNSQSEETAKSEKEAPKLEETVKPQNETTKSGDLKGKEKVPNEKSKVEIIKNGKIVGAITRREKEWYKGAITRAIWKRKMFSKLYSVMGLQFVDRETMITDEIMKVDKNVIDVRFTVLVTFVNAPRSAVVAVRHAAGDLNAFKEFGKFFNNTFQHWFAILYRPYCKKSLQNTHAENKAPAVTDEEAAAKELKEAMKEDKDLDKSDSDSDSDFSYEDERVDPNATNSEAGESKVSTKLGDADKNSKNQSNSVVKKQSVNDKKCDTNENYDNKVQADKIPNEDGLNASDKSPRRRKHKKQHAVKDLPINHLNDRVEALNLNVTSLRMNNMRNQDKTHQQQTVDDQNEGKESQNTSTKNKNRTRHGDHNDTGQEIIKSRSTRYRHRKGKDNTQSAPADESGRTRSAGENGQMPSC